MSSKNIFITPTQLKKLVETAMDLDIYVQPIDQPFSNGNEDINETLNEIISKLGELKSMFETGKKISTEEEGEFFKILDNLNKLYSGVKFQKEFTSL